MQDTHTDTDTCTGAHTRERMQALHTHKNTHIYTHAQAHTHRRTHAQTHMHRRANVRTRAHTHTHTHTWSSYSTQAARKVSKRMQQQ